MDVSFFSQHLFLLLLCILLVSVNAAYVKPILLLMLIETSIKL